MVLAVHVFPCNKLLFLNAAVHLIIKYLLRSHIHHFICVRSNCSCRTLIDISTLAQGVFSQMIKVSVRLMHWQNK